VPKMLAQANRKLVWVPQNGIANVSAPTAAELNAGTVVDLSCLVTKGNYTLGPSGDETINDPALCASGNSNVPGNTNYEAGMDFFRWTTTAEDKGWNTFTQKGIEGFLVERIGTVKSFATPFVAGDKARVFGAITSTPRTLPIPDNGGFEKFRQEFMVQSEQVDERATVA